MGKLIDLSGQQFGRLTVIKRAEDKNKTVMWICKCDCGNIKIIAGKHLRYGLISSCGCYQLEDRHNHTATHRMSKTRLYKTWLDMRDRCYRTKNKSYVDYGGKGITVCSNWKNAFEPFCKWALASGYTDDLTIDRINSKGNYEPSNCRWVKRDVQAQNRGMLKNNSSGHTGIRITKSNKYNASLCINGKNKNIGTFSTIEEAILQREKAQKMYWNA